MHTEAASGLRSQAERAGRADWMLAGSLGVGPKQQCTRGPNKTTEVR